MDKVKKLRQLVDHATYEDETTAINRLIQQAQLSAEDRIKISHLGAELVQKVRDGGSLSMMENFLAEYGLATDEGLALMCLSEALLRVPDAQTMDLLIKDKVSTADWTSHRSQSPSRLVNASTLALMLTANILKDRPSGPRGYLARNLRRMSQSSIRAAIKFAMKVMGHQFVLGETIEVAIAKAANLERQGYKYSYDMLGEAARHDADARRYFQTYAQAIDAVSSVCDGKDIHKNPGISVKLSALHPRFEWAQKEEVLETLAPRLLSLAQQAKSAGMGINVDAEEARTLGLYLEVIQKVLSDSSLEGWSGFGVVVQAYGQRASSVLDFLYHLAHQLDRRIMVRLVKGAYWDSEIKHSQVEGVDGFPVFTHKAATDISYIANARKMLTMSDRIYSQFATHNAHTAAAILHLFGDHTPFEFQRLHGMGEGLHDVLRSSNDTECCIYAPVGVHGDLLPYLVRRLLENGANSSFVNQFTDRDNTPMRLVRDPFKTIEDDYYRPPKGPTLFSPERQNSQGFDLSHPPTLDKIEAERAPFSSHQWNVSPQLVGHPNPCDPVPIINPADHDDIVGKVAMASALDVELALANAEPWRVSVDERSMILNRVAASFEENFGQILALLAREAGKTLPDAVAEWREAVDFLRYYAAHALERPPMGIFACISPWNFPLAIFVGQVSAALAAGNAVVAKPAEQTPLIGDLAVSWFHQAGVPHSALQYLPGSGEVGALLTSDSRIGGVAFTGSTQTAITIRKTMAQSLRPGAPLIAETGGLNAMIVDSTSLLEQAVQAITESAFQSAGQRCSALRCLYVQDDIADDLTEVLSGAMDTLKMGHPWRLCTDVGPVIDESARQDIKRHIEQARTDGRLLHTLNDAPDSGTFVAPTLIRVEGIHDLTQEVFGPVLHLARFKSEQLDSVIHAINRTGYGLTFGIMSRIDDRIRDVTKRVHAGNLYANRNQIGAVVGSQPFGGEGLSGTGPKAGGPHYLARFHAMPPPLTATDWDEDMSSNLFDRAVEEAFCCPSEMLSTCSLPGPTGEINHLTEWPRDPLLCMGPGQELVEKQAQLVRQQGGVAITLSGRIDPTELTRKDGFSGVIWWGSADIGRDLARALSQRDGPIIPLITGLPDRAHVCLERHICIDSTASGGDAALMRKSKNPWLASLPPDH